MAWGRCLSTGPTLLLELGAAYTRVQLVRVYYLHIYDLGTFPQCLSAPAGVRLAGHRGEGKEWEGRGPEQLDIKYAKLSPPLGFWPFTGMPVKVHLLAGSAHATQSSALLGLPYHQILSTLLFQILSFLFSRRWQVFKDAPG